MKDRTLLPIAVRFISAISSDRITGCWNWLGNKNKKGYGKFWWGNKTGHAHQFALEYFRPLEHAKQIVGKLEPDHLCRNTSCVNPFHLEIVTRRENLLRGLSPVAINFAKKTCVHGHPFTVENTYIYTGKKGTERQCKTCNKERARRAYRDNPQKFIERKRQYDAKSRGVGTT